MSGGYFDYDAAGWVRDQYSDEEWDNMADGEHERLIELEEQDREFLDRYLDSLG